LDELIGLAEDLICRGSLSEDNGTGLFQALTKVSAAKSLDLTESSKS
jgi:hypothetical protein